LVSFHIIEEFSPNVILVAKSKSGEIYY